MRKGFKRALFSCLLVLPLFLKAHADELKMAYVNIDRIIQEAPAAVKASKKMEQEFAGRRQELQKIADDIEALKAALSEKGSSLSESQRRAKETDLSEAAQRFLRRQQELQEDVKIWQNEAISAILEKANKAIIQIAESEHLDVVIQEAIAVSNRLDITDKVIKKLTAD